MKTALVSLILAVALLAGCRDATTDTVRLRLAVQGTMLAIRVENRGDAALSLPAGLLDRTQAHALALVVTTERGSPVAACRDVAAADGSAPGTVAPGTAATLEVPAQDVMDAYCLESGRAYRVQAVLARGTPPVIPAPVASNTIVITLNAPAP